MQAVLDAAGDEIVVLKFKREGCPACKSTITRFADLAHEYRGRARLFTVECVTAVSVHIPACPLHLVLACFCSHAEVGAITFRALRSFHQCHKFCQTCGLRAVPCVHIYQHDKLLEVMGLGPSSFATFADLLAQVAAGADSTTDVVDEAEGRNESVEPDPWDLVEPSGLFQLG